MNMKNGTPNQSQNKRITSYQCEKCFKFFSRRDHLRTHFKNIHGEDAGPFACVICSQLYKNAESLRKHIAKFHFPKMISDSNSSIMLPNQNQLNFDGSPKNAKYLPM